jgi:hypothetical protein
MVFGWHLLLLWPEYDRRFPVVLSWALGAPVITLQLFVIRFLGGWSLGWWAVVLVWAEIILLNLWHKHKKRFVWPTIKKETQFTRVEFGAIFVLGCLLMALLVQVWSTVVINYDAVAVWALRVKILWFNQSGLFDANSASYWFNLSKSNYPWHLSLLGWLETLIIGDYKENWINVIPLLYFLGLLATVYSIAREKLERSWSLVVVILIASMSLVFYHASNFYADLPLTFAIGATILVWRQWLVNREKSTLYLTTVLGALTLSFKTEALVFIGLLALLTIVKLIIDKSYKQLVQALALFAVICLPGYYWIINHHLGLRNSAPGLGWHPQTIEPMLTGIFASQNWHLWWFLVLAFFMTAVAKLWRQVVYRYSLALAILMLVAILAIFLFTEAYIFAVGNETFSRTFMVMIPISVVILTDSLNIMFKELENKKRNINYRYEA